MKKIQRLISMLSAAVIAVVTCLCWPTGTTRTVNAEREGHWEYSYLEDGSVRIDRYYANAEDFVATIPDQLGGRKVAVLGENAFRGNAILKTVQAQSPVYTISANAFREMLDVEEISLQYVNTIGEFAFAGCRELVSIELGENLTEVGMNAFQDCPCLTDIYFRGTKEQWESIRFAKGNYLMDKVRITVNYGSLTKDRPQEVLNPEVDAVIRERQKETSNTGLKIKNDSKIKVTDDDVQALTWLMVIFAAFFLLTFGILLFSLRSKKTKFE